MLLCCWKGIQYHLKIFIQYYKLIMAVGGGRWVRGFRDVGYFTFRAGHGSHNELITELPNNVKGR